MYSDSSKSSIQDLFVIEKPLDFLSDDLLFSVRGWKVAPTLSPHTPAGLGWVLKGIKDSSLQRITNFNISSLANSEIPVVIHEISFVLAIPAS